MFVKRLKNSVKQARKWSFKFGGNKLLMANGSSEFLPLTLDTLEKEAKAKKRRKALRKGLAVASLGILLTGVLVQAGNSFMGSSIRSAQADNTSGKTSSAMDRVKNQIDIASGKADGSLTSGEWGMSDSEFKTIGFFLSNYYTPFTTKMGKGSAVAGDFGGDITKVLTQVVGMNEDSAKELSSKVVSQSNASQVKLKLAKSNDNGKTWKALNMTASYYEVLFGSVGIFTKEMLTTGDEVSLKKRYSWENNGTELLGVYPESDVIDSKNLKRQHISYEWNPDPEGAFKPVSQVVFHANFSATGSHSWGSQFITFDKSDEKVKKALDSSRPIDELLKITNSDSKLKDLKGTIEGIYEHSIYSANMYIDSFGNLLSSTGGDSVATYVILPASQNPMMYASKIGAEEVITTEGGLEIDNSTTGINDGKLRATGNAVDAFNEEMNKYYNNTNTGVGKLLPLNNLNTLALLTQNGGSGLELNVTGVGQASLKSTVNTAVEPVYGSENTSFDEATGSWLEWQDSGAILNELMYTQWLISRVPISEDFVKYIDKTMVDARKTVKGIKGGKDYLPMTTTEYLNHDMTWNFTYAFRQIGSATRPDNPTVSWWQDLASKAGLAITDGIAYWFNAVSELEGAESFAKKFQSLGFKYDAFRFYRNLEWSGGVIDSMVAFDKFNFANPSLQDTSDTIKKARMTEHDDNGEDIISWKKFSNSRIQDGVWRGSNSENDGSLGASLDVDTDKTYGVNIYVSTYIARAMPTSEDVDYVINLENTPTIVDVRSTDSADAENMDAVLKNMAYYMLNPTKGREYKQRWSKTFANQIILNSLNDMVGANTASTYAGTTRYLELTGLATIPRLDEIKFTSMLYEKFDTWGIFILIIASVLMLLFVFVGQVKVLPAIVSVLAFGLMVYTPPKMINSMINLTNTASNAMFNDKFTFWVLATHQNYEDSVAQLMEAAQAGNVSNYTALLLQLQSGLGSSETDGETDVYEWQQTLGATIKVRWMAPKKDGYVTQVKRDFKEAITDTSDNSNTGTDGSSSSQNNSKGILERAYADETSSSPSSSDSAETTESSTRSDNQTAKDGAYNGQYSPLTSALMSQGLSNEDFTGLDTNYLYRGYTDIADYSRMYYGNIMGDNVSGNGGIVFSIGSYTDSLSKMFPSVSSDNTSVASASDSVTASEQRKSILDYLTSSSPDNESSQTLLQRARLGFMNDRKGDLVSGTVKNTTLKRIFAPISSPTVSQQSQQDISKIRVGDEVGLNEDYFILSMRNFNDHNTTLQQQMAEINKDTTGTSIPQEDAVSLSTFALYTESPFYYLSWNLYDNGLSTSAGSSGEFKTMMLENNDAFFYNYQIEKGKPGYGALKDFMDFGSLFTVVIPYLREANKTLLQWDDTYGTKPFDGYGITAEELEAIPDKNSEAYYKTWFNYSADNAYRTYSAWVDALYDLDIAQPETIKYGGVSQEVDEPLNPASYKVRPMVFSESEMEYYGLTEDDLTRVETAILKTSRDIRNRWLDLMNYYTLDDVVLNTSAAMTATFAFNENFSQKGFNQNQVVLEPQGFELKTFGFDAYLRMILQNATGESIAYNQSLKSDIYEIVAEKDGTATLIAMWVLAFIVVYFLPVAILLTLCALPIAMILSVFASFIRQDRKFIKTFSRECMMPFLTVLGVNLGITYVVSVLMGNGGYDLVTGDLSNSQSFSSPRSTIFFLIFCAIVAVIIYLKSLFNLFGGLIKNAKLVSIPVKASVEMASSMVLGNIEKLRSAVTGKSSGGSGVSKGGSSSGGSGTGGSSTTGTGRSMADQSRQNLSTTDAKKRGRGFFTRTRKSTNKVDSNAMSNHDVKAKQAVEEAMNDKPRSLRDLAGGKQSSQAHDRAKDNLKDIF